MSDCQITCIIKPDRFSRHEHISKVGNPAAGWVWPREDVIRNIDNGTDTFFVVDSKNGKRADVGVVKPRDGRAPFLQTYADGDWNDNLLSLPQC